MNKSLKRAIDYLAIEDADVCNELERGVDQISLQLVAHAFDIDPYVLLGKVWDRKYAWFAGRTEPAEGIRFKVTEGGVYRIWQLRSTGECFVNLVQDAQFNNSVRLNGDPYLNRRAANAAIRKDTALQQELEVSRTKDRSMEMGGPFPMVV
jgi:hypothetical protein